VSVTVEIVRFAVPPARAERLVAGHEPARLAIDAVAPGWIWSRLARVDERGWIELVAWRDLAAFERALARAVEMRDAADWFDLADPGWTIELGVPVDEEPAAPPAEGYLELVSSGGARGVTGSAEGAVWSLLLELGGRRWQGDSWTEVPETLLRVAALAGEGASSLPPEGELAEIAHSCDFEGKAASRT
jgi:hypothetical protein